MRSTNDISLSDCKKISKKIREEIFKPANSFKTTIFLCGADKSQKDKMRFQIAESLTDFWHKHWYDLIYPEDIFDELLYSSQSKDLLSLEGLLAESVDAIVLIPESPGSFAELGAFANDEKLRNKLICIVDDKYKKDKSFINQGPLKLVKNANKHGLIFIDPKRIDKEIGKISTALGTMKKASSKVKDKITLLQTDNFLLPTIYLLEPVSKSILVSMVGNAMNDEANSFQATTTALTILSKKRLVELTPNGYKLTSLGVDECFSFQKKYTRIKTQDQTVTIDNLRLEILNLQNRKKKLKV